MSLEKTNGTDSRKSIEVLTPDELAAHLKMSKRTLAKWRTNGRGPRYIRLGHGVRYREQDVAAWLEAKVSRNSAEAANRR
jgi:excisionase family DNA binding protein